MELKRLKCPICGKNIDPNGIDLSSRIARCPACDETYIIEQAQNFARVEVDRTKDIQSYRQNLSKAVDLNDAPGILRCAQKIRDILPDDYEANYFFAYGKAKHEDDDRLLYSFLDDDALDCTDEAQERVVMHLIKYGNIRDEKRIVQFIGRMGNASERYLNLYRQEFEKKAEEEELYDDITRDVFICHRSTDGEVANRIVRELERDGNKCWISSRNLRPNDNENYWDDIHRAVKSCRIFLVVSTRDAMISADVKKEIGFAKDLNKKRLEVKIDDSEHTALFKDFFDGCKWIKGENYPEIKRRVADLVMQELRKNATTDTETRTHTDAPRTTESFDRISSPRQSAVRVFEDRYSKADSNKARIGIIRSFIIPSSPEDLLEFAVLAASNVDESLLNASIFSQNNRMTLKEQFGLDASLKQVNDAWMFKLGQVYQQANAAIPRTPELDKIEELYYQKKQTGRKKKTSSTARTATPAPSRKPNPAADFKHRKTKNVTEKRKEVLIVVLALLAVLLLAGGGMGMLAYTDYKDTKAAQTPMPIPPVISESGPHTIEAGRQYAFMSDEWDVYIANAISDSVIKIEYWHKSSKSSKSLKYSSDVGTYLINDEENGFGWLDEQHTAFVFTFQDENSGRVKKAAPHVFTINISDSNTYKGTDYDERIACYLYTCDNWHMYRAIPLSDSLVKIECWSRGSTSDKFCFGWDWYVINWNSTETDFAWIDEKHSGFTITTQDAQNRYYWKQETLVAFMLENEGYTYKNVYDFLNSTE